MRVWNFVYLPDKSGEYRVTLDMRANPQFFLCGRRFPDTLGSADFACFDEVITLTEPIEVMTEEQAQNYPLTEKQQILCEFCILDKNGNDMDDSDIARDEIEGFAFCGFEIADEWEISALTNQTARTVLNKLYEEYGGDPNAKDLFLFAVWRRVSEKTG